MRPLRDSQERGVSLAEALVAVAVLGFVGVVMVAGIYTTVQGNKIARINITAESLARYELEYVKSVSDNWTNSISKAPVPWSYTLPGGSPGYPTWDSSHNSLPSGYTGYSVKVQGARMSSAPYLNDPNIQQVTATVMYNGKQEAQIAEYITNNGP